ncbi:MAG: PqqD family protein [Halobacteriales archaeon]|nr:PqqD family protein [Halobacteriales archaeon]
MNAPAAWRAAAGVVAHGGGYLTDTRTGEVYAVNATAFLVFEEACRGQGFDALVAALAQAHPDASREEIAVDVQDILSRFVKCGLLEVVHPGFLAPPSGKATP